LADLHLADMQMGVQGYVLNARMHKASLIEVGDGSDQD
jgi:hypothetical protein